jgi:hypothetical protein
MAGCSRSPSPRFDGEHIAANPYKHAFLAKQIM